MKAVNKIPEVDWDCPNFKWTKDVCEWIPMHLSNSVEKTLKKCKPISEYDFNLNPKNKKIHLFVQFYFEKNPIRRQEIIDSIQKNINNKHIDKISLLYENCSREVVENTFQLTDKVLVQRFPTRLKFHMAFNFIKKNFLDDETIYIIINNDCYLNQTVKRLKNLDFEKSEKVLFVTLSRFENYFGTKSLGRNPIRDFKNENEYKKLPFIEPWSSDAWCFKSNSLEKIDTKDSYTQRILGTELCEIILTDYLIRSNHFNVKNLGMCGFIECIHQHKSNSRKPEDTQNNKKITDFIPGILPSKYFFRDKNNSIKNCWRLRSSANWLDKNQKNHEYQDIFCVDLIDLLYEKNP